MSLMGDHFWPSVYPGIAAGILLGFYLGGLRNIIVCAVGALVVAFLAFSVGTSFFAQDGLVPVLAMLGVSLVGAYGLSTIAGRRSSISPKDE
jgi:ABC-type Mn2+/Zn2+ transport system permease subunit